MSAFLLCSTLIGCCLAVICMELLIQSDPGIGNLVTVCSFLFISIDGFINEIDFGRKKLKVPITEWMKMVVLFFLVNVINNASFKFNIAMPLYMVFKSGSLVGSMIAEKIFLHKIHSSSKHLAVTFITIGIILCTYSSSKEVSKEGSFVDWIFGIFLLSTSLILSARMGIYQQEIYAKWGKHYKEALFFTHFLPLPGFLILASDISTHFKSALSSEPLILFNLFTIPTVLVYLLGNILSQYICARSVFHLSTEYSSLTITMILTLRKFFSIFISVWLFDNVFNLWHWIGTIFVFIGTLLFSDMHSILIAKVKTN